MITDRIGIHSVLLGYVFYMGCIYSRLTTSYMLFAGREVRIGKNGAGGLEYGPRPAASGRTQDQGHSFSQYGPT